MFVLPARFASGRLIALAVLTLLFACVTYGFAASNTVPAGNAGDGTATISGYAVSGVKYNLNAANPSNIDSVEFSVTGVKPSTVKANLVSTGENWYSCSTESVGSPWLFTCATTATTTLPQLTTAGANQLRVVAAN